MKKSFFAMTENSQDRWCVSLAAMRGTISNIAKPTADARIDSTDLSAARIANRHHLRDFRSPAIFEFFNTIGAKPTFHRPLSDISLRSRLGAVVWTPNDLMLIHLADELRETGAATRNVLMVSRISAVASLLDALSPAETKRLGTLIRELLARQDTTELDRFTICRMCDDPVCTNCPLPTTKSKRDR